MTCDCCRTELEVVWPVYTHGPRPTTTPQPPPEPVEREKPEDQHYNRLVGIAAERFILTTLRQSSKFFALMDFVREGRMAHTESALNEALRRLMNRGVVVRTKAAYRGFGRSYLYQLSNSTAQHLLKERGTGVVMARSGATGARQGAHS